MTRLLGDWLAEEPFTLALSAGFFGFYAHMGVLSALDEAGLSPSAVRGSSAGALVSGIWASGVSPNVAAERLLAIERDDFWDPGVGAGWLRGVRFRRILHDVLDAQTFEACRVPVKLSVWNTRSRQTEVHASGDLAASIHASCCFPGLFHPVRIDGVTYLDGGIADRWALHDHADGERTFHHHLASRSPWRRKSSPALRPPERANLRALVIDGLPRVSPSRLDAGRDAFAHALERTRAALVEAT